MKPVDHLTIITRGRGIDAAQVMQRKLLIEFPEAKSFFATVAYADAAPYRISMTVRNAVERQLPFAQLQRYV